MATRQNPIPVGRANATTPMTSTRPTAVASTSRPIAGTSPVLNPVLTTPLPATTQPPSSTTDSKTPDDNLSSNTEIITQSSIIPQPQTIPIDPSDGASSDPSSSASPNSRDGSKSLPVVAIVIISIVGGVIGLLIVYRLYRRLFYRFQRQRRSRIDPTQDLVSSPPPTRNNQLESLSASKFMSPANSQAGLVRPRSQYYSQASNARSSVYHPTNHNYQYVNPDGSQIQGMTIRPPDLGPLVDGEKYDNGSSSSSFLQRSDDLKSSPTTVTINPRDSVMLGSEPPSDDGRGYLLGGPISSQNSSVGMLNPLLSTRDHSTLSTDTLRHATRRQSVVSQHQHHRLTLTDFVPPMPDQRGPSPFGSQVGSHHRISRMSTGLPHLHKPRTTLTLPTPLAPSEGFVNVNNYEGGMLEFGRNSGINQDLIPPPAQQPRKLTTSDRSSSSGASQSNRMLNSINTDEDRSSNTHLDQPTGSPLDLLRVQLSQQPSLRNPAPPS